MVKEVGSLVKRFRDFVDSKRTDSREDTTHTILKKGGGKFCFVGEDYQKFMKDYAKIIKSGVEYDLHFVERCNKHGVTYLFIDVDYDHKKSKRLYNDDHIKQIIEKTNEFLKENFDVTDHNLTTFVTEKPEPTKRSGDDNMYKDGFHIYYPHLPMEEKYRYYVIDYLVNLMVKDEFLDGIAYKNNSDKIFDTSIIKSNGILMIGSKKEGGHPYELTHVYDQDLEDLPMDEYDSDELIYLLSNQRYDADASIEAMDDDVREKIDDIAGQYDGGNTKKKEKEKKKTKKVDSDDEDEDDNNENNNENDDNESRNSNVSEKKNRRG